MLCNSENIVLHRECYHYEQSGLDNIFLDELEVRTCLMCGTKSPIIPKIVKLHNAIGFAIYKKYEIPNAKEFKFLRKEAGYSRQDWAVKIGSSLEDVIKLEEGSKTLCTADANKVLDTYLRDLLMRGGLCIELDGYWASYIGQNIFLTYSTGLELGEIKVYTFLDN